MVIFISNKKCEKMEMLQKWGENFESVWHVLPLKNAPRVLPSLVELKQRSRWSPDSNQSVCSNAHTPRGRASNGHGLRPCRSRKTSRNLSDEDPKKKNVCSLTQEIFEGIYIRRNLKCIGRVCKKNSPHKFLAVYISKKKLITP